MIPGTVHSRVPVQTIPTREERQDKRHLWRIGVGDFEKYIIDAYEQTAMRIASGQVDAKSSAAGEAGYEL